MDVKAEDFESFIGKLLTFKMIVNELGKETADRTDIDENTTDLDFYVDKVSKCSRSEFITSILGHDHCSRHKSCTPCRRILHQAHWKATIGLQHDRRYPLNYCC
jgi:hypothetical protein